MDRIARAMRYRNMAEAVRRIAKDMRAGPEQTVLLTVAQDYTAMANELERQIRAGLTTRSDKS